MKLLVTGSSSGIGKDITLSLLKAGHEVWGLARSEQSTPSTEFTYKFYSSTCDVSKLSKIKRVASCIKLKWGYLDGIITCAGVQGEMGRALKVNPKAWTTTARLNLEGTYNTLRIFNTLLEKSKLRAKIVCFSGGGSTQGRPYLSAYGCAKTAIVRLVETIALEEVQRPLDINCIAPGAINTRLTDEIISKGPKVVGEKEYNSAVKQKQDGGQSIDQAIALVNWLISPKSDGISGKLISAQWDSWASLSSQDPRLKNEALYTLRRVST